MASPQYKLYGNNTIVTLDQTRPIKHSQDKKHLQYIRLVLILFESNKNLSRYLFTSFIKAICINTCSYSVHIISCIEQQKFFQKYKNLFNLINFILFGFFGKNLSETIDPFHNIIYKAMLQHSEKRQKVDYSASLFWRWINALECSNYCINIKFSKLDQKEHTASWSPIHQ